MITQRTAGRIWNCYREIEVAEMDLADMAKYHEYRSGEQSENLRKRIAELKKRLVEANEQARIELEVKA